MVAGEGLQVCILPAPRITKTTAFTVVTRVPREVMFDWVLFVTSIADHRDIVREDGRAWRIGSLVSIVKVPTREGVEARKYPCQTHLPTYRTVETR